MNIDPSTTKYLISARLEAEGIVEKPDVVGAVFGQTEGLLGDELDLRDLQKRGGGGGRGEKEGAERGRAPHPVVTGPSGALDPRRGARDDRPRRAVQGRDQG